MDEKNNDFWNLYYRLLRYDLSVRETNYLLWRFYNKKTDKEIAFLDGKRISPKAVNKVIQRGYRKIRGGVEFGK